MKVPKERRGEEKERVRERGRAQITQCEQKYIEERERRKRERGELHILSIVS